MRHDVPCAGFRPGWRSRDSIAPLAVGLLATALSASALFAIAPAAAQLSTTQPAAMKPAASVETRSASPAGRPAVGPTGLPLPRFVSLKSDRVNMRTGPGTEYPMQWVYRRAGLPIEVIREFEAWRQVRDSEGATGWVLGSLLSSRRTALVEPWTVKANVASPPQVALKSDDRESSANVAIVEAGVIATVRTCDGRWCAVTIGSFRGYLQQTKLWGVYKGETVR